MLLMTTFLGGPADNDSRRTYQRDSWGSLNPETCVIGRVRAGRTNLKETTDDGSSLPERVKVTRHKLRGHPAKLIRYV
jgi:hypothetical protein